MTYGIEVWGPYFISKSTCASNHSVKCMLEPHSVEKLNLHLCKFVLGVSRKATNDAVRGEVGRLPILLITARRWVSFTKHAFCLPPENLLKCSLPPATDFGKNEKSSWSAHMFNMMSLCNGISYPETPLLYPYSNLASMLNALTVCQDTTNKDGWNPLIKYMTTLPATSWKHTARWKLSLEWKIMFVASPNLKEDISLNWKLVLIIYR